VVPPFGEPPAVRDKCIAVVVEAVRVRPTTAGLVLADLAHEEAAHGGAGPGPLGKAMWALRTTNSKKL